MCLVRVKGHTKIVGGKKIRVKPYTRGYKNYYFQGYRVSKRRWEELMRVSKDRRRLEEELDREFHEQRRLKPTLRASDFF